ncbi:hypothetical protein QAD02_016163 [Eretmocerus hayati]|uniref:Uncharacterized protein n=1 Tax=Eretmocerus hayati TaxID=131215 RepID=A0ACC2PA88_9HYME|nr:hypothetical protein QAD02_016163 [Eretmocerus hayati]
MIPSSGKKQVPVGDASSESSEEPSLISRQQYDSTRCSETGSNYASSSSSAGSPITDVSTLHKLDESHFDASDISHQSPISQAITDEFSPKFETLLRISEESISTVPSDDESLPEYICTDSDGTEQPVMLPSDPSEWTSTHVHSWLDWCARAFSLDEGSTRLDDNTSEDICGRDLLDWSLEQWKQKLPGASGPLLARHLGYLRLQARGITTDALSQLQHITDTEAVTSIQVSFEVSFVPYGLTFKQSGLGPNRDS